MPRPREAGKALISLTIWFGGPIIQRKALEGPRQQVRRGVNDYLWVHEGRGRANASYIAVVLAI
jgi:hypothetical protein